MNHREKLDAKENEKLNKVIRQFLRLFASTCGKILVATRTKRHDE